MMMVGRRSESIYRGMALADEVVLQESAAKLDVFHQSEKTGKRSRPPLSSPRRESDKTT